LKSDFFLEGKMKRYFYHRQQRASILIDALMGLGVVSGLFLPLIALFSVGLLAVKRVNQESNAFCLVPQILEKLHDRSWPGPRTLVSEKSASASSWQKKLYFDEALQAIESGGDNSQAAPAEAEWEVQLTAGAGLGWQSTTLESIRVQIYQVQGRQLISTWVTQRYRS
jgi:hypothetical protein